MISRSLIRLTTLCLVSMLLCHAATAVAQSCTSPDNLTRVTGNNECLAILTTPTAAQSVRPVLVVWIHGDVSSGGPADYMDAYLPTFAASGVVQVRLLRPGYEDSALPPNLSTGSKFLGSGWTPEYIDATADALRRLRAHHNARYVVVVGHSGGAIYSSVILGRHPGVIDASLLVSTAGDLCLWRSPAPCTFARPVLNPIDFISTIPPTAKLIALVGSNDTNTRPVVVQDYVNRARAAGVNIEYVEIAGGEHGFSTVARNRPQFDAALRSLIAAAPALAEQSVTTLPAQAALLLASCVGVIGAFRLRRNR